MTSSGQGYQEKVLFHNNTENFQMKSSKNGKNMPEIIQDSGLIKPKPKMRSWKMSSNQWR